MWDGNGRAKTPSRPFATPCLYHIIASICNARRGRALPRPDVRRTRFPLPTTLLSVHAPATSSRLTHSLTTQLDDHRRPKKRNPSDKNRTPAEYAELPPPPPEFKVVSSK